MPLDAQKIAVDRSVLRKIFPDPKSLRAFEQLLEQVFDAIPTQVNDNTAELAGIVGLVDALRTAPFVTTTPTTELANERVLTSSAGAAVDLSVAGLVSIIVNVVAALGYTPANRAGDTFTGPVDFAAAVHALGALTVDGYLLVNDDLGVTGDIIVNGSVAIGAGLDVTGQAECDSLRVNQAPTATATLSTHSIPVSISGTTYYMRLSATP